MARIVIDPITRIEGHLRIEAQVEGGKVVDAWSSSTMFRGIEIILKGRGPKGGMGLYPADMRRLNNGSRPQLRESCRRCFRNQDT